MIVDSWANNKTGIPNFIPWLKKERFLSIKIVSDWYGMLVFVENIQPLDVF